MAQTPVANSVQLCQVFQQNADETPPLKRPKKKHGTPTGKNVVVLKRDDVLEKDGVVFMPNTIEMAQLKKTEKGQFKTNVQISSKMSEMDIKQILEESFPLLANRTFYCAGAADNRTRLDFHGERRIWDGRLIKQKIKGNSVLYIFTNEERLGKQYPTSSKLAAPKRSYDQMTQTMKNEGRIETVGHSVGINQNFISTQSKSQTREPLLRTADMRAEANQSHSGLQGMVSPPLSPQMGSLTISHTASEWEKAQCAQATVGKNIFMHAPWEVKEKQGEGNNSDSTVGESYHPPIQSSVVNAQVNWAMDTACINKAVKVVGTSESDYESQLSDLAVERFTDSGFEASDGLRINDGSSETGFEPVFRGLPVPSNLSKDPCADILNSQSGQDLPSDVNPPSSQLCNTKMLVQDREETSSCGAADDVPALLRDLFGTVQGICPSSGSVKGGFQFNITLDEALPEKVKGGEAHFEAVNVPVRKLNPFTLSGIVPSSQVPGTAAVTVITDSGQDLGFTFFEYIDDAEDWLKQLVEDPMLQSKYFALLSTKFAHGSSANTSNIAHGKGKGNLPGHGSSVQKMQQQSVKLLQLMVYTAAQTNAQEFIEMIFSTSAGQIVFNAYKDKTPLPEDVARENGHDELARYFQDVHARLSLDKNGHSTVIDWLELLEAVQKQSLTTQDESPVGLDQSDEDDDDSSDYFADAETSSCGSCDDDPGWPEISEKKESCVQDGISSEVQITSESNDLSMTCSSKASFTKNERIIKGESTKGQTTRNDICFVVKQGSSCLDKGRETGEYSELSSSLGCVADLLEMSCEDLNNENSISKGPCIHGEIANEVQSTGECNDLSRTSSSKALFTKNERIITGESTKGQITRDEISFVVKQGSSCLDKGEEREISELSKPQRITSLPELFVMSCEDPGEDNLNFSTSSNNMAKEPKEPCIQEVTSNEVRPVEIIVSWCDDRSMTSSKASFTKNEKIVEVESTKRQTTSEDRAFAMKQGSSCLEKGKEREFSELSRPEKISCLPKLLGTSCEDLNSGDIISTESWARDGNYVETYIKSAAVIDHSPMNKFAMKTSDSNNDSILTGEELNQEPTAKPDGIAMNSKAHIKKEEEDASAAEEGVILDTEASEIKNERVTEEESSQRQFSRDNIFFDAAEQSQSQSQPLLFEILKNCRLINQLWARDLCEFFAPSEVHCSVVVVCRDRPANERLRDAVRAISDAKTKGVWKCLASEFRVSEMTRIDLVVNKWKLRYWSIQRETLFSHLKLLMKEQHLLEREQLFAMERLLSQKLSTKTKQLLSVRLMKRLRKFQGTYEVSGDPVCKSVNSYEGEPREVALAILFELFLDPVAAQTSLESTVGVRNSKINQTDRESQQVDKNDCKALKLCKEGRGAQVTYEAVQASLHVNDVQLEDLAVGFRRVLQTKPLESNLRKTDEITVETLFDLSCDLREEWKYLAFALGVGDAKNDRVDERNQTFREKSYNMLLLWKQRFGPQATYKALEVGLCHDSVQREDLVKKYCHDIISSAMQ